MPHELQILLDGSVEPTTEYAIAELVADLSLDLAPRTRVRIGLMRHPQTHAYCHNVCNLEPLDYDSVRDHLREYFDVLPAMETFTRGVRLAAQIKKGEVTKADAKKNSQRMSPTLRESVGVPEWYPKYLRTAYWKAFRHRALDYYGGCVVCPRYDLLEVHHRHYETLANEGMRDVSVLCREHHELIRPHLGIKVPRDCPEQVERLLFP